MGNTVKTRDKRYVGLCSLGEYTNGRPRAT